MPRPHKCRYVGGVFEIKGFKPAGIPGRGLAVVELGLDEVEAIRLADLQGLYQEEAARQMGISRATFGRVLDSAHQKIADAIINGKMLIFKGGNVNVQMASNPQHGPTMDWGGMGSGCRRRRFRGGRGC